MINPDLSKAFDLENHRLLFLKLEALFIAPAIRLWLACFLGIYFMNFQIE